MTWLVLCAAGGHEREAARIVNRNDGAAYVPETVVYGKMRPLLPGYVFARWLYAVPWQRLEVYKTPQGLPLIFGFLARAGSDEPATVSQREIDLMEANANETAREHHIRHKAGDLIPQKLGMTGAEINWRVAEIRDGLMTLHTVMLGKIIEKQVREAA